MSILEVSILLHYWASPEEYPNSNSDAFCASAKEFVKHGILIDTGGKTRYKVNEEIAKPYIDAVTSVPLPTQNFVIPPYKVQSY